MLTNILFIPQRQLSWMKITGLRKFVNTSTHAEFQIIKKIGDRLLLPVPHSHWESGALYKLVYQQPRFEPLSSTILMRGTAV